MNSFEDIGVAPELVEALAAAGIERPTSLQESAIPVVRRANNLVLAAGPGAGTLVAWGVPLLERLAVDGERPAALVLTPTAERAARLAESLALLASATGHAVSALGTPWALPGRAHIVFGTPRDFLAAIERGEVAPGAVEAVVLTEAAAIAELEGLPMAEAVLDGVPSDAQRVVVSLPLSPPVADFVKRHVKRSTTLPPQPAGSARADAPPHRGNVEYVVAGGGIEDAVLGTVARLLAGDASHVLVFCRSEDRAADLGDFLTLRGFLAGAPGDAAAPVWLGVEALAARAAAEGHDDVRVVSADVPADPDDLDRRHGIAGGGVIIVLPRELEHLKGVAARTGYGLTPRPSATPGRADDIARLGERLARAVREEDVAPWLVALAPLFEEHDPAELAAAAVALLRRAEAGRPAPPPAPEGADAPGPGRTPAWAKLFVSVGERDGLRPGDLVGAIIGEAHVPGDAVGRIDIRESHSVVEVHDRVAEAVIRALNGTTMKGRAVRVDFDRPRRGGRTGGKPGPRRREPRGGDGR